MNWLSSLVVAAAVATGGLQRAIPDIHYTPTRHAIAEAMLALAGVGEDDVVYDLGSGDGRLVVIAAQRYGARGVGVEIDPGLVALARNNARDAGVAERVTFVEGDLFNADLSAASVVTLYLSNSVMRRLEPKLQAELKPGTRVVSHQFHMPTWTPDKTVQVDEAKLHLYEKR